MLLDDKVLLDNLRACLSNRNALIELTRNIYTIYKDASIGGKNKLKKYVNTLSGLIYSPDTLAIDIKVFDVRKKNIDTSFLKKEIESVFFSGLDIDIYDYLKNALLYGSVFIKLIPPKTPDDDVKYVMYMPYDVLFLYPTRKENDEGQFIVVINRITKREFMQRYGSLLPPEIEIVTTTDDAPHKDGFINFLEDFLQRTYQTEPNTSLMEIAETRFDLYNNLQPRGELVEFYEVYYYDFENERWNMAIVVNDRIIYHGVSPYTGALYPIIAITFTDNVYGESAVLDLFKTLMRLKQLYIELDDILEWHKRPPFVIISNLGDVERENIQNNLKPGGIVVLADPTSKIEQYKTMADPQIVLGQIKMLEEYMDGILMLNEALMTGQFKNVRSFAQLSLHLQATMSDVKAMALRFEAILEQILTQLAYMLVYYKEGLQQYMTNFYVEVFAHSSSPVTSLQYQEYIMQLLSVGILDIEDVIDMLPIPNKERVVAKFKTKQTMAMLSELAKNQNQG